MSRNQFALVSSILYLSLFGCANANRPAQYISREVEGNYDLNLQIKGSSANVYFSSNADRSRRISLEISAQGFKVVRHLGFNSQVLKNYTGSGRGSWHVRVLKKGNFYRFWVNESTGWIRDPLGVWETDDPVSKSEPMRAFVGVETPEGTSAETFKVTTLPWLQQVTKPVLLHGPEGTFKEGHVLPGGIIHHSETYYMYFTGSRHGNQEGGGAREIGVASSSDLTTWKVQPEPIVRVGAGDSWEPTGLYCSGAVITPDNKIAIMYAAQDFPNWGGFGLALADHPLGPFRKHSANPVFKFSGPAHEFDLVQVNQRDHRYFLFFSGFTKKPQRGPAGDRGYLIYSDDLTHWTTDPRNPVFSPETLDNWDSIHVRPRSLNKIGDTWYLWYEGNNHWDPGTKRPDGSDHNGWWDTVGLARSKDLVNWEYYPRNPALPALGISKDQFDHQWVGWPRMVINDDVGYIFYVGGADIGMRTIPLDKLTDWSDEGGKRMDLIRQ